LLCGCAGVSRQTSTTGLFDLAPVKGKERGGSNALNRTSKITALGNTKKRSSFTNAAPTSSKGGDVSKGSGDVIKVAPSRGGRLERLSESGSKSSTESRSFEEEAPVHVISEEPMEADGDINNVNHS
jgi:hypothetical protein